MIDEEQKLDDSDISSILAEGLVNFLSESEGIAVHYKEHAYLVYHEDGQIKLNLDDDLLTIEHLRLLWVHDKDDPNDQIPDDAEQIPTRVVN